MANESYHEKRCILFVAISVLFVTVLFSYGYSEITKLQNDVAELKRTCSVHHRLWKREISSPNSVGLESNRSGQDVSTEVTISEDDQFNRVPREARTRRRQKKQKKKNPKKNRNGNKKNDHQIKKLKERTTTLQADAKSATADRRALHEDIRHLNVSIRRCTTTPLPLIKFSVGDTILPGCGILSQAVIKELDTGKPYCFWSPLISQNGQTFAYSSDGKLHISENGTYLIFAQILFHDAGPRTAFAMQKDNTTLVKCVSTTPQDGHTETSGSSAVHEGYHMCATTTVLVLQRGDSIHLAPLYISQVVITDAASTFWGVTKLGP